MAKVTGSLVITARDGSGWESDGDGRADGAAVRGAGCAVACGAPTAWAASMPPRTADPPPPSQHRAYHGPHAPDKAAEPVGPQKLLIQPRQATRPLQLDLPTAPG